MKPLLVCFSVSLAMLTLPGCRKTNSAHDKSPSTPTGSTVIASKADVERVAANLDRPETRLQAVRELLAFAEPRGDLEGTDEWEAEALREKAYQAVRKSPHREAVVAELIPLAALNEMFPCL